MTLGLLQRLVIGMYGTEQTGITQVILLVHQAILALVDLVDLVGLVDLAVSQVLAVLMALVVIQE